MTDEQTADVTAPDDQTQANEAVETIEKDKVELTPEQIAEEKADVEKEKQAEESRTQKRRRQRANRDLREAKSAQQKAEIDAAYWKGKAESGNTREGAALKPPQQDDYENYDDYIDAKFDWKMDQAAKKNDKPQDSAANTQQPSAAAQNESPEFSSFQSAGGKEYGRDWDDMMDSAKNNDFSVSEIMAETMMSEEHGPKMAMHFYDNQDDADRISRLSPLKQVQELTKISDSFGKKAKESLAKTISGAPDPISTERGSSSGKTGLDGLTMDEYVAKRRKQKQG